MAAPAFFFEGSVRTSALVLEPGKLVAKMQFQAWCRCERSAAQSVRSPAFHWGRRSTSFEKGGRRGAAGGARLTDPQSADIWICVALLAVTLSVYVQVVHFDFLNYDDDAYVATNTDIRGGLTLEGVRIAFTRIHQATWHPVTTLSHMLDCSLFGLAPGAHHLINVVLHALNTIGLFWVLRAMTGARWRSAFVAAMFGLHPAHVESVAWVSERKDVLSTFFWVLTVASYWRYVQQPRAGRYAWVVVMCTLALLSKPMVVTLPVMLLLLDVWPLRRITLTEIVNHVGATGRSPLRNVTLSGQLFATHRSTLTTLVIEKVPLLIAALGVSAMTVLAQRDAGAMVPIEALPMRLRLANVPISYVRYLGELVWPVRLAILYPYPPHWPAWQVTAATALLLGLSLLAGLAARRHPYVLVGWLWYLITLLPVIGLLQVGIQAMADRFTYVPFIGLFIIVSWGGYALLDGWPYGVRTLAVAGMLAVAGCTLLTERQVRYWRDSVTLFEHALAVTTDNYIPHVYLGKAFLAQGRVADAAAQFAEWVRLTPQLYAAHFQYAGLLADLGQYDAAVEQYGEAVRLRPDIAAGHYNLANALVRRGDLTAAMGEYERAITLDPDWPEAHHNLGIAFAGQGRSGEALAQYDEALRLRPDFPEAYVSRGLLLTELGRTEEAIAAYLQAIALRPALPAAQRNVGIALAREGRTAEAIAHLEEALRLAPDDAEAHQQLGALESAPPSGAPTGSGP
jgi:tetratricopeptide (TPR) repeat protein